MATLRLTSNYITATEFAAPILLGTRWGESRYGHFDLVKYDNGVQTEIQVEAPLPVEMLSFYSSEQSDEFGERILGYFQYPPVRLHENGPQDRDNTKDDFSSEDYAYTTIDLGPRLVEDVWNVLLQAHFQFMQKGGDINYSFAKNSNSYVNTLLWVVGVDLDDYSERAMATSVNSHPGADFNILAHPGDALGLNLNGLDHSDVIRTGYARDSINGLAGNDSIFAGAGADSVYGGAGADDIRGEGGPDLLRGDGGRDTIFGGDGEDTIYGDEGNDYLKGEADDDVIRGGSGNDTLFGDQNNDDLYGESGDDTIDGGSGLDTAHFEYNWELYRPQSTSSTSDFRLDLTRFDQSTDRLVSIEKLQFENRIFDSVSDYFEAYTDRFLTVAPIEEDLPDPDPIDDPDKPSTSPTALPLMYVRGAGVTEGDSGTRTMRFEVELGKASTSPVSFIYSATGGNSVGIATTGTDFEFAVDTVTFSPGQTLKSIPITVFGDKVEESDEYLNFLVSNITGAELARGGLIAIERGYIRDDDGPTVAGPDPEPEPPEEPDGPVYLTIETNDESEFEGSDGSAVKYDFTVRRTGDLDQRTDFRVDVSGYGANSANSADFDGGSFPTIYGSFSPGDDREGVDIFISSDTTQEADEYFEARLRSSDATAIVTADRAYAAILNDDGDTLPPQGGEVYLSIRALQSELLEGTSDTQRPVMQFEITRTGDLAQVTEFRLREGRIDYPTIADDQRDTFFLGTSPLFEIGQSSYIADIRLRADDVNEPDEVFTLQLRADSDYPNTVILNEYASTLVLNDDGPDPAQITSDAVAVMETGGSQIVQIPVTLSKVMPVDVSMTYEVRDRTNATAGDDYVAREGVFTVPAGSLSANLEIEILGDSISEPLEGIQVRLEDPVNGYFSNSNITAWDTGVVVFDDDTFSSASVPFEVFSDRAIPIGEIEKYAAINVFFDLRTETELYAVEVEVTEPIAILSDSPSPDLIFDEVGNLVHANMSSFNYLDGGSVNGIGDNYVFSVGTYYFVYAVPETQVGSYGTQLIGSPAEGEVPLLLVDLTNGVNLGPDLLPFGAVGGMTEGGSGLVVRTSVSHEVDYDITYDVLFRPISASVDDIGSQTLVASESLEANDFSEVTFVFPSDDAISEPTELFEFVITNVVGAVLPNGQLEYALPAVIFDNDVSLLAEFDIEDVGGSRAEGTGATTNFEFKVSRPTSHSDAVATVDWRVLGDGLNAASRFDFVGDQLPEGLLSFDIGETEKSIFVNVAAEVFAESDESFVVELSNPSEGFGLRTSKANALIRNDDGLPESPIYGDGVVVSSISYQMGEADTDLILSGAAPVFGVGNETANSISGNNAQNILEGREGNDELWGFDGEDQLSGGDGFDILTTGTGADVVSGSISELIGDRVTDFTAEDKIVVEGVVLEARSIPITSGSAKFSFDVDGDGTFDGELTLEGSFSGQAFEVSSDGTDTIIRLAGADASQLSVFGERFITPDPGVNRVYGDAGDDVIVTSDGADILSGGDGADALLGGPGTDILLGGLGSDVLTGGADADIFAFDVSDFGLGFTADFIRDFVPGEDLIELSGFGLENRASLQFVTVADGDAIDLGEGRFIVLEGLSGADITEDDVSFSVSGRSYGLISTTVVNRLTEVADRFITTDPGANEVRGGGGGDAIVGGDGQDILWGEAGDDVLTGGPGGDRLIGGPGADVLTGRDGSDVFEFTAGEEAGFTADFITDFEVGEDTVLLQGFGFDSVSDLTWTATESGTALQLQATHFVVFEGYETESLLTANEADWIFI